jgi:hypothetical protein
LWSKIFYVKRHNCIDGPPLMVALASSSERRSTTSTTQ